MIFHFLFQNQDPSSKIMISGNHSHMFDIRDLTLIRQDTFVRVENVSMEQGQTYHAVVIATDQSGGCMLEHANFSVDATPPVEGNLAIGADYGQVGCRAANMPFLSKNHHGSEMPGNIG